MIMGLSDYVVKGRLCECVGFYVSGVTILCVYVFGGRLTMKSIALVFKKSLVITNN